MQNQAPALQSSSGPLFRRRPGLRTLVEPLEARIAPANVFWDGGGDGTSWTSADNWSNNAIPTGADDVTVSPAGVITIAITAGAQAVASLSMPGDDVLAISGGSLALAGASVIHNLALSGSGSLVANAALSLTGASSFSGSATLGGSAVVTNNGTLGIASGDPNLATELVNAGTIRHGNAFFDLDGTAAKLRTVAGGLYETVTTGSGFSFRVTNGSPGVFIEAGATFRHNTSNGANFNTGAGTAFSNLGKVEVALGALNFTTPPAQITGAASAATLTGGAWEVANGATLNLGITGLRTNAADITVRGAGGFTGLGALATNSGALSLLAGADLTTAQAFTNGGALTLSAGSVLTAPSFTQSATGSVAFEIAGTAAAQFGRIATAGAATLGGTAQISVAPTFSPAEGQNFPLMNFASRTGTFASVTGLNVGHANLFEAIHAATNFSLNSLVNASNLAVETVSTPGPVAAGNDVSFTYTVRNTGAFITPVGAWSDTIYLSKDGVVDSSDIVLTRITHNGAVAAGDAYTANVNVPLVGTLPADYQIIVVADALGRVADTDRANNTLASTGAFTLSIPTLTPGVAFNGTLASGRDQYFQITLPAGETPNFTFTGAVAGQAEIYTSFGEVPTRADFLEKGFSLGSTVQQIAADVTAAGTYYVLLHGRESAGGGQSFSLVADGVGFDLTGSSLDGGPNIGKVTTTLTGSQFSPGTTFTLVPAAGAPRAASAVYFVNARTVHATFDLTGLAGGDYDIVATKGAASDSLDDVFRVTSGGTPGTLKYSVSSPSFVRPQGGTVTITFENAGDTDLDAPLFNLLAENARLRLTGEATFLGATFALPNGQPLTVVELLGVSGGLAGILSPGERGSIELSFQAINSAVGAISKFEAQPVGATTDPVDFSSLKDDLRPAGVRADAWDAIFTNFQAGVGGTTASYRDMLVENANYLGQFGPVSADVTRLVEFELEQAGDFGVIAERYTLGALGRGNVAPFSLQATTEADGDIVLSDGLTSRAFSALGGGTFAGTNLERGKLTRGGGGELTLTEATGEKTVFRASDGRIDFVQDTNGNRITAAWDAGGRLLTLTESATGDVTTFTHNAQGRIATVTDAVGRVTTYGYDAGGEHLTSITTPRGTTSYTYTATGHAVASATDLNGVTTSFTYDARGRLAAQTTGTGGDALVASFDYDNAGGLTVTESGARETHLFRTLGGSLARLIDPLGQVTSTAYDAFGRIVGVTDASGLKTKSTLTADGLLAGFQNSDRTQIGFDLGGDLLRLRSVTDPGGDITRFGYGASGNLLSTTRPDGATERFEYDAAGRVTAATDGNGQRSTFTYDADGLVTQRAFPDGTQIDYTYDARRNLLTATDAEGATTFTYDAADRITSVAYPNGKSVAITYDAQGRRATVADQTGYTVRYSYDSLSRLDQVRHTANALLVDYGYDALGQLASETRGNGSSTAYTYDGDGRVATITHSDAVNATTGSFAYTYDAQDRVKTATSAAGTTTYTYDLVGQLTRVDLPAGRTITYAYDAEGNRTSVIDSAAGTENYTTNNGDQYTTAGEETLTHDGAGRILTRTQGGVTTSYTYDSLGQLTGITAPGSVTTFDYDALGNRIGKTENGVRTDYASDPLGLGTLFGEYNGAASTHYASGLGVAARESAGSTQFYHYDATGNTALVSGAAGAALATYTYLPFGEIAAQTGALAQPFTFNGQFGIQDDPGELFYMRARAYDAELGRFTSRDPIGFTGGDANLYRFAGNDPVNMADPSGLYPVPPGALAATGFYNGVLPGTALPAVYVAPAPIGGTLAADTALALNGYTGVSSATGFSGTVAEIGTVGSTGALGLLGTGLVAAGVGLGIGTLIDEITEVTNPELKQAFRDSITKSLGYPDGSEPTFSPDFVKKWGKNPYFNDIVRKGITDGLNQDDAILDAIRIIKKLGLENETGPGTPNKTESRVVRPSDPNNIIGPAGSGADPVPAVIAPGQFRFDGFVSAGADYGYTIQFENQPSATAPAQVVRVTQTLDADLDFSTFTFTGFGFGAERVAASGSGTGFHAIYDATAALGVLVQIDAELNTITGVLDVTYTSLDPATNDVPLDPFAGFLPANDATGRGDGFLTYSVQPKAGLANATDFTSIASIVFDTEGAIATPTVTNTLDTIVPTSQVTPFAAATFTRTTFAVRWTGSDDVGGSGLAGITLAFTDNGGPLQTATVANADGGFRFTGEVGHTYAFFSQAVDNVGNTEALALTPDATITVIAPPLVTAPGNKITLTDADGDIYTVKLTGAGTLQYATLDPDGAGPLNGPLDFVVVDGTTNKSNVSVTVKKNKNGGDGIVTIGDVIVNGALANFAAKASDLNVNGLTATGAVKSIAVRDLLQPDIFAAEPLLKTGGAATDKLTITARNLADGFAITTPQAVSALTAAGIGDGSISAAALGKLTTTFGAMNASLVVTGAAGPISVKLGANAGEWRAASFGAITLGGTLAADIESAGAVGAVSLKAGNLEGDLDAAGAIKSISVKTGALHGQITGATLGAVRITGGDLAGFLGSEAGPGKTQGLGSLTIAGGNLTGRVLVAGNAGAIAVKESTKTGIGGAISGPLTAHSFGAITLAGGGLSGAITATGSAAALGKTLALASLSITGGDLAADVRLLGGSGAINVKADKLGAGGNLTGLDFTAAKIAALTVAKNVTNARLLAGTALGADGAPGGGDDTFAAGSIGTINIGGNVVASIIAAGLANPDALPNNADDTIVGGVASIIAGFNVKGTASADSYFAAGKFKTAPKIGAVKIDPANAPRFFVG